MANAGYVLWTCSTNVWMISLSYALEAHVIPKIVKDFRPTLPSILRNVNKHQLLTFLGANIATGTINMVMDTINAPNVVAIGIIIGYLVAVCTFIAIVERVGFQLKL